MDTAEDVYDFFTVGSDRIWFPGGCYDPAYNLKFVHSKTYSHIQ